MNVVVFVAGLLLAIFSHPKIMRFVMTRLFNEGLVVPKVIAPRKAELIRFAGPNLSLFTVGVILIIISAVGKFK